MAALLPTTSRNAAALLAGAIALLCVGSLAMLYPAVAGGDAIRGELEWLPAFGLDLLIRLDGLTWVFAFLVLAIGFLVVLYAR